VSVVLDLVPDLSPSLQSAVRSAYGILMLLTLVWAWPHRRRFFLSERWNGYAESRPGVDLLHRPTVFPVLLVVWAAAVAGLAAGAAVVPAAFVNLLLCRFFFVHMRWKGVLRGMGAPGFIAYWLGAVVFLLEFTSRFAPGLRGLALLVAQADFALIMASAGIYKLTAGYAGGHGMDFGMVNPQWSYWWRTFKRFPPGHWLFRILNHLAWTTEIAAAVLMLLPPTRALGGLVISVSFLLLATQIRLAWLSEMLVLCGLLFVPPGHAVDAWIAGVWPAAPVPASAASGSMVVHLIAGGVLVGYLVLLPFAHAGLFYNLYARRRLPGLLQQALERYTNFFGIIIWRVFSVDHLDFFVRIYAERGADGRRTLLSRHGSWRTLRFSHVAESIVLTTLFTTLKYYPSQTERFEDRLRRYARTLDCPDDHVLVFQYVSVNKGAHAYEFIPAVEYTLDPLDGVLRVAQLRAGFDVRAAHRASPVHEGAVPGSYAPAAR
jgi:hypothetical protein